MKEIHVKIDDTLYEMLEYLRQTHDLRFSAVIKAALRRFLSDRHLTRNLIDAREAKIIAAAEKKKEYNREYSRKHPAKKRGGCYGR